MYLIVGLGNPGKEYEHTRHNIGFDVLDLMSQKYNIDINRIKFKGIYGEGRIGGERVILLKPTTYMNLSGESVRELSAYYKIEKENIVIIYDDISLEVGRMRIRQSGSAGGHNGIKNIIAQIGSEAFPRIKIGVGGAKGNLVSHVLGSFNKEERDVVEQVLQAAVLAAESIITKNLYETMNLFNGYKVSSEN